MTYSEICFGTNPKNVLHRDWWKSSQTQSKLIRFILLQSEWIRTKFAIRIILRSEWFWFKTWIRIHSDWSEINRINLDWILPVFHLVRICFESFRTNPKNVLYRDEWKKFYFNPNESEQIRNQFPNQSEKRFISRLIKNDQNSIEGNPFFFASIRMNFEQTRTNFSIWIILRSEWSDSFWFNRIDALN